MFNHYYYFFLNMGLNKDLVDAVDVSNCNGHFCYFENLQFSLVQWVYFLVLRLRPEIDTMTRKILESDAGLNPLIQRISTCRI